jgi:hypothetical protein
MRLPARQVLDPKIEAEFIRQVLASQEEADHKRQTWEEKSRKLSLAGWVLLLIILFLVWFSQREMTGGVFFVAWIVLVLAIEGWNQRRKH